MILSGKAPKDLRVRTRMLSARDRSTRSFAITLLQTTFAGGSGGPLELDRLSHPGELETVEP